ncbi:MAG: helix-turn-helix domain-containing protein [Bacteroidota bacterium]
MCYFTAAMLGEKERIRLIFALKIKYLRVKNDLSYHRLSDVTGLSKSYLHDIEKGRKYPKIDKINALASAFDVTYDDLVSTAAPGKIKPIVDILNSDFLKVFPLELFGLDLYRLFDLFSSTPDKINAFISTVIKITRNYQLTNEHFYAVALRSYQEMHDNYFPALEQAAQDFASRHKLINANRISAAALAQILEHAHGVVLDREMLPKQIDLQHLRSYYSERKRVLYLNEGFSEAQENFLLARELAFQELSIVDRPYMTRLAEVTSFDQLLNNFKASYFAVALLANEHRLTEDLDRILKSDSWNASAFLALTEKYSLTPEMLFQRMTNVLPKHFGIRDLFFLRLRADETLDQCDLTKELHLSQLHNPYGNLREEHYCRRWNSIQVIKQWKTLSPSDPAIDIQISDYWKSDRSYLCISLAHADRANSQKGVSLTIGMLVNEQLKKRVGFLRGSQIKKRTVNTTCERCSIPDCESRMKAPVILQQKAAKAQLQEAIKSIEAY